MWKIRVWSLDWDDPLEKGMATYSSILAWRIPWTEEQPGGLQSMGSQRVRHYWVTKTNTHTHTHTHTPTHTFSQARRSWPALKGRTVTVWKERDYWFSVHYYKIAIWKQVKSASQHHWAPIRLSSEVSKMSIRKHTSLPDGGHGLTQNRKMLW